MAELSSRELGVLRFKYRFIWIATFLAMHVGKVAEYRLHLMLSRLYIHKISIHINNSSPSDGNVREVHVHCLPFPPRTTERQAPTLQAALGWHMVYEFRRCPCAIYMAET